MKNKIDDRVNQARIKDYNEKVTGGTKKVNSLASKSKNYEELAKQQKADGRDRKAKRSHKKADSYMKKAQKADKPNHSAKRGKPKDK